jgi:hypothetical protein
MKIENRENLIGQNIEIANLNYVDREISKSVISKSMYHIA